MREKRGKKRRNGGGGGGGGVGWGGGGGRAERLQGSSHVFLHGVAEKSMAI